MLSYLSKDKHGETVKSVSTDNLCSCVKFPNFQDDQDDDTLEVQAALLGFLAFW